MTWHLMTYYFQAMVLVRSLHAEVSTESDKCMQQMFEGGIQCECSLARQSAEVGSLDGIYVTLNRNDVIGKGITLQWNQKYIA